MARGQWCVSIRRMSCMYAASMEEQVASWKGWEMRWCACKCVYYMNNQLCGAAGARSGGILRRLRRWVGCELGPVWCRLCGLQMFYTPAEVCP